MAQRTRIELFDDIDDGPADETVFFGVDGKDYEIDLSEKNAKALRSAIQPYVNAGRRSSGGIKRRKAGGSGNAGDIRAWAISQGLGVSARGRVSAEIRAAYEQAQR
ncbi:MAG: Lsr2 family protein [Propionibacteriaceae bacterium]|nr:Lsr2 family protein [Propionibacteriaceae bacterium]